ncbi:serine hydrolase [Lacihabitans sp. CCS-44]|uniref:serine hydrolase n=1 Tax=Lacihabitans sp. CCS-44 TaxID=2487331 RepID=UPI0020CE70EA|nr:serine hydrolase [Lacihabitans sp. CCS-44]MCP9754310.1 serine hydrolase [Lacihabitans sp. CCS-44]
MKKSAFITFGLFLFTIMNISGQKNIRLKEQIIELMAKTEGHFGLAFKNLDNNDTIFINPHEYFHAASTMKTPVMLEIFNQEKQGKFKITDSIFVKNEFESIVDKSRYSLSINDDSDDILYQKIGQKMTIQDLTYEMMTKSSNLSTNILIDKVGAENVMKLLASLNIKENIVLRGVEDQKAFDAGLNNRTTPFGLMQIFEHIALTQPNNSLMLNILLDQKFNEIIPAQLSKNVKVAHKTGSITGVQHDSGIVYLADGRKYVLILLSKNLKNANDGVKTLAQISKMIYDYLN